jgi:hypothetical protein
MGKPQKAGIDFIQKNIYNLSFEWNFNNLLFHFIPRILKIIYIPSCMGQ